MRLDAEPLEQDAVSWTSRERRKRHSRLDTGRGRTWWAPGAVGWWVGVLFAAGATLFALGAAPGYATVVGSGADALTFFIGSVFFTSAALLQYLEAVNADGVTPLPSRRRRFRILAWEPRNLSWWSSLVQLAGTLYFNISTLAATHSNLSVPQDNRLVWRPDAIGSICFLVASSLAWWELVHAFWSWQPRSLSWWIVALNVLGSVAFGVSAIASYVVPTSGSPVNIALVNLGTFVGAICFFAGALLLLPERTLDRGWEGESGARINACQRVAIPADGDVRGKEKA